MTHAALVITCAGPRSGRYSRKSGSRDKRQLSWGESAHADLLQHQQQRLPAQLQDGPIRAYHLLGKRGEGLGVDNPSKRAQALLIAPTPLPRRHRRLHRGHAPDTPKTWHR